MTDDDKRKTEPPLSLDMSFGEALGRFVTTDPKQVDESIERSKQKRPPQDGTQRRSRRNKHQAASPDRQRKPDDA